MINYVVGFIFDEEMENILLIKKNRPKWQENFYNGIGGKIEENEIPLMAMIRELKEESDLQIEKENLFLVGKTIFDSGSTMFVFTAKHNLSYAKSMTDEQIHQISLNNLSNIILVDGVDMYIKSSLNLLKNNNI